MHKGHKERYHQQGEEKMKFRQSLKFNNFTEAQVSKAAHLIFQHLTEELRGEEIAAVVNACEGEENVRFGTLDLDTQVLLDSTGIEIPRLQSGTIDGSGFIREGKVVAPSVVSVTIEAARMADNYLTVETEKRLERQQKADS